MTNQTKKRNSRRNSKKNKRTKTRGGSLAGAPLNSVMRPGLPAVAEYATYPTEVAIDPKSAHDLDVYFNSALSRSCGTENTSATVWPGIGTNQFPLPTSLKGGSRRRRSYRRHH